MDAQTSKKAKKLLQNKYTEIGLLRALINKKSYIKIDEKVYKLKRLAWYNNPIHPKFNTAKAVITNVFINMWPLYLIFGLYFLAWWVIR